MPITAQRHKHNILIVHFDGKCPTEDISQLFLTTVFPLCHEIQPEKMHILYDITKLDWTFNEFVNYLSSVQERRKQNVVPENIAQYFLGTNQWTESLRDWLHKRYNNDMGVFNNIDNALSYIRLQSKSDELKDQAKP